jgi:hypothetical protein
MAKNRRAVTRGKCPVTECEHRGRSAMASGRRPEKVCGRQVGACGRRGVSRRRVTVFRRQARASRRQVKAFRRLVKVTRPAKASNRDPGE